MDNIERKCEIILEQLRLRLIDGEEALKQLKEFYTSLNSTNHYF